MVRLSVACVFFLMPGPLFPQEPVPSLTLVDVRWMDVVDQAGGHRTVPVMSRSAFEAISQPTGRVSTSGPSAVLARDERWRMAKVAGDRSVLEVIESEDFLDTGSDGLIRNRSEALQAWVARAIRSIRTDHAIIRIDGDTATVTGEAVEVYETSSQPISFSRAYCRLTPSGDWILLSSTEKAR